MERSNCEAIGGTANRNQVTRAGGGGSAVPTATGEGPEELDDGPEEEPAPLGAELCGPWNAQWVTLLRSGPGGLRSCCHGSDEPMPAEPASEPGARDKLGVNAATARGP